MSRRQLYVTLAILVLLVSLGLVVGCVPSPLVEAIDDNQDQLIDEALLAEYQLQSPRTPRLFHDADEAWLGGPVATLRRPADPRLDVTYAFSSSSGTTLQQIASDITVITGHPVSLSPDLYIARVQRAGVRLRGGGDAFVTSEPADEDALPSIVNRAITYRHNGPLHEFLDRVATELGITWRWDSGRIVFERFVTRTFRVALLPGTVTSCCFADYLTTDLPDYFARWGRGFPTVFGDRRKMGRRAGCRTAVGGSSRFAAPSLRCGPAGDPPPSIRRSASMAVSAAFGHGPIARRIVVSRA